ncbi:MULTISPECIES: GAF and ANTAR domain-containing protein [unclassified Pseudonocardia]|uniref:GAF and ANTAR domain-containing protein n=1 Tax=unclassified Pseudonocardia TaxID=2619320 RepID=UPI000A4CB0F8|nr:MULTISPECIES: GAF and ANTAR domain-containing protein [unclassified Pseudonocardia]MBN9099899.1 GAF and ANTAR domain-containing protein [Pseudonocardia sp.]
MAELGTVTRALLGMVRDGDDERALAGRICRACVDGLDVDGAAISLFTAHDSRQTLWATDAVAELLEELQFALGQGACMEAATTGRPVLVADVHRPADTVRWPIFAAAVVDQTPVRALFALPLQWGAVNLGVLDLYRATPGGLSDPQWRDARGAVDTAALMILGLRTDPDAGVDGAGGWLDHTTGHRAEIHQATGMVLAQLGIGPTDALARLRGHAFAHQRPLIDVARDVVARRMVFTEDMI